MNEWMQGYNSDVEYTSNYYKEITPNHLNFVAVLNGIEPIDTSCPFNYCELGCGQGLTILTLASLYPHGKFWAVDYNPTHIAKAKKIAKEANLTNIVFLENSFQDLVEDTQSLAQMDFMVFHGIYAWVSDENRMNLVKICKKYVVSGGFVYNSYNAKPGWSDGEVLQKLIFGLAKESKGNSLNQIDEVINRLDDIKLIKSGFFHNNEKAINKRIDDMKDKDRHYLVHEYLNEGWKAFYFSEVSNEMADAKLSYLAQATPAEIYMPSLFEENIQKELATISKLENRELLIDLVVNRSFRRDLYIRGYSNKLSPVKQINYFLDKKWILINNTIIEEFKFLLPVGEVDGDKKVYTAIINYLREGILTTRELLNQTSINAMTMIQILTLLSHNNYIALYYADTNDSIKKLNQIFAENALEEGSISYIIVPQIKDTLLLNNINITFLDALYKGLDSKEELVEYVYDKFNRYELSIIDENKRLSGTNMKKRIVHLEKIWRKNTLPFWEQLGLV